MVGRFIRWPPIFPTPGEQTHSFSYLDNTNLSAVVKEWTDVIKSAIQLNLRVVILDGSDIIRWTFKRHQALSGKIFTESGVFKQGRFSIVGFEGGGTHGKEWEQPWVAESNLLLTARKDTGALILQLQETESCYNNMSLEEDTELQIRMLSGQYLDFILVRYWAENLVMLCQTSDLTELWADKWVLF